MTFSPIDKPVGVVGDDELGASIALRFAISGRRVIFCPLAGAPAVQSMPRLELAATPTDVAFDCPIVLVAIGDTERMKHLLLGDAERMGLGAEMFPGSVLVDTGARTARELGAFLGLLGTRVVAVVDAALIGNFDLGSEGVSNSKILLGGYPDAVELAHAALEPLGSVERTGPLGSAHATAAMMGYVEAAHAIAREEALALGNACGVRTEILSRLLGEQMLGSGAKVIEIGRQTELAKRIARDRSFSAEIIDLAAERQGKQRLEKR